MIISKLTINPSYLKYRKEATLLCDSARAAGYEIGLADAHEIYQQHVSFANPPFVFEPPYLCYYLLNKCSEPNAAENKP